MIIYLLFRLYKYLKIEVRLNFWIMAAKGILLQSALNHVNGLNLIIRAFTVLKKKHPY